MVSLKENCVNKRVIFNVVYLNDQKLFIGNQQDLQLKVVESIDVKIVTVGIEEELVLNVSDNIKVTIRLKENIDKSKGEN